MYKASIRFMGFGLIAGDSERDAIALNAYRPVVMEDNSMMYRWGHAWYHEVHGVKKRLKDGDVILIDGKEFAFSIKYVDNHECVWYD